MDTITKQHPVPTGLDHLALIREGERVALESSAPLLAEAQAQLTFLGTAFAALYEVGTCNRKCWGGPHLLESLCVRVYNLGISAYTLMVRGFYDEALNLIRSVGEIGNLIALSVAERDVIRQWVAPDKKTRLREFGPAAVRRRLENAGGIMIAPQDWYAEFCEVYTHATPGTTPNMHNQTGLGWAGGVVKEAGFDKVLDELVGKVGSIALMSSAFAQLDDYVQQLSQAVESLRPKAPDVNSQNI